MSFFKKYYFIVGLIVILCIAIFLRFYHYGDRWGLAYDQAHDALVARYALSHFQLPLLGPFSSAGAFQTGGEWYWIIMLGTFFYPGSVMSPWFFITAMYVLFVVAIVFLARELIDKQFALIVGLLAAVSSAQTSQSTNLTNQSPLAWFSLLAIWCSIRFLRTKQRRYLFGLSLFVSIAASIHLQGAPLILLVIFTLLFAGIPRFIDFFFIAGGLLLPWFPVLLVDLQNNFYNTRNMIQYYLHDQYKISLDVLGRRWLTYGGILWPKFWSYVIGGHIIFGYLAGIGLVLVSLYKIWKKTLPKEWAVLLLSFAGMVFMIRYVRAPVFESYIVFLHPFLFLFSGWLLYLLFKKSKFIAVIILCIVIVLTLKKSFAEITFATNTSASNAITLRDSLKEQYPNTIFTIYDYKDKSVDRSYPLVLYLDEKKLVSGNGRKIGVRFDKQKSIYLIVDLQKKSSVQLKKEGWVLVTPEEVYMKTEEWYKK